MSKIKSIGLIAGMSIFAAAPQAQAEEFDGTYDFFYEVIGGDTEICVTIQGEQQCAFVAADVRLYDGEFTEESASDIAEDSIDALEDAIGREFKPVVEEKIYAAALQAYGEVEVQINEALDKLPTRMSVFQMPWDLSTLVVELGTPEGASYPAFGEIDLDTGAYDIMGFYAGVLDREQDYAGHGVAAVPLLVEQGVEGLSFSINGELFSSYESLRHVEEPPTDEPPTDEPPTDEPPTDEPPTDEPPTDEPPTDEPPTDEPPTDEPPADDNTRVLQGVSNNLRTR